MHFLQPSSRVPTAHATDARRLLLAAAASSEAPPPAFRLASGRSHRSNQVSAPHFVILFCADIAGEARFASAAASSMRRMGGAKTKSPLLAAPAAPFLRFHCGTTARSLFRRNDLCCC